MAWQRPALLILAGIMLAVLLFTRGRPNGKQPVVAAFSVPAQPVGWLQVSGAVDHGGTYPVFDTNMTSSVIKMSNPFCGLEWDEAGVRQILESQRGLSIVVACRPSGASGYVQINPLPAAQRLVLGIPLLLNLASEDELVQIPGVGPVLAKQIIQYRQKNGEFRHLDELLLIKGIAEKKLTHLKLFLTI